LSLALPTRTKIPQIERQSRRLVRLRYLKPLSFIRAFGVGSSLRFGPFSCGSLLGDGPVGVPPALFFGAGGVVSPALFGLFRFPI
jgi:hypothetical protein